MCGIDHQYLEVYLLDLLKHRDQLGWLLSAFSQQVSIKHLCDMWGPALNVVGAKSWGWTESQKCTLLLSLCLIYIASCGYQIWFPLLLCLNIKLHVKFNIHWPTAGVRLTRGKNLSFSKWAFSSWEIILNVDVFHFPLHLASLWGATDLIFVFSVVRLLYN